MTSNIRGPGEENKRNVSALSPRFLGNAGRNTDGAEGLEAIDQALCFSS